MKQLFILLSLVLAASLTAPAFAQDSNDIEIKVVETKLAKPATDSEDGAVDAEEDGFKVSINLGDDQDSADKKLKNAAEKLSIVLGEDFGNKMALELDGMSEDEKEEVIEALAEGFSFDSHDSSGWSISESLIAFTAIILSLGMPIIIVSLVLIFGHRKRRQKMDLIRTYLDAGKDVPEQILNEFGSGTTNTLRSGVTPLAIGSGMIVASFILDDATALAAFGLIPLFIGLARLVYWKYENQGAEKRPRDSEGSA